MAALCLCHHHKTLWPLVDGTVDRGRNFDLALRKLWDISRQSYHVVCWFVEQFRHDISLHNLKHSRPKFSIIVPTCGSTVSSKRNESVFVRSWAHSEVVVLSISAVSFKVGQVYTQSLTRVRRQQMKIVVTCTVLLLLHTATAHNTSV